MKETKYWTWHIITAGIILVLLGLHMFIQHLDLIVGFANPEGGRAIAWENVLARSQTTAFVVIYIVLLGAALYHGLYGLRTILFELNLKKGLQKGINWFFWIGGVGLFLFGSWAAIAAKLLNPNV